MFKIGQTYFTREGGEARVICIDSPVLCKPVVAIVRSLTSGYCVAGFTKDGTYNAPVGGKTTNNVWDLTSDEPTEAEATLIEEILAFRTDERDADKRLLGIIRRLKAK